MHSVSSSPRRDGGSLLPTERTTGAAENWLCRGKVLLQPDGLWANLALILPPALSESASGFALRAHEVAGDAIFK